MPVAASTLQRDRILVVEDDVAARELLQRFLGRKLGYEVHVVDGYESAVAALDAAQYDLVIADRVLGDQEGGIDLIHHVRAKFRDLDVIIMTAYPDLDSVLAAVSQGAYDYLIKPFESLEDVHHCVSRALEKRRIQLENRRLVGDLNRSNAELEEVNRDLERKVAERTLQLTDLALTDDVTGLRNQRFLFERLEQECERARRYARSLAVVMLDVDNFKEVNDEHDHLFGSRVLRNVGKVLVDAVRGPDSVIRYGGDEFTIIMPETDSEAAQLAGERLRVAIEGANVGDAEQPYHVTASLGVAVYRAGDGADTLLRAADQAAYEAKRGGKNRVVLAGKE